MSNNLSDNKNKENEDDKIGINKDKKLNIKEREINSLIEQEKISKLLMNKEKSKRKTSKKKKKGMSDERVINKEALIPPECTKVPYIPEKINNKQKTLVIDLDETLVHSYFEKEPPYNPDISFDIEISGITIHISTLIRPGAYQFLEKLSNIYEIVIFTASLSQYAIPLLNEFDKNNFCKYKLFREHCYTFDNKGNPGYVKDLSKLNRDLNNIIIIDNNPDCYFLNKENGIPIKTWLNDRNDKELFKLLPYLEFLANEYIIDVRPILTKIKDGKTINFKILDEIIENYKKSNNEINNKNDIKNDNNITINENNSKTIESSNIINNNKQYEAEKENENNNILKEEDNVLYNNSRNIDNNDKMKINEANKIYQDRDMLINNHEINIIKANEDLKKSEKELKEEKLNKNKESDTNIRNNEEEVKRKEYKERKNNTDSISKKKKSIKNSIINSLEKNHKKIFLKINEDRKLLNNVKCESIIQKNIQTIKNENIFNRHRNIKTNDNNAYLYKNRIFDEQLKLNTNENQTLCTNESKANSIIPFKLNEKKENFLKIKLKEFDFKIKHFNIKLKSREKDNSELKNNKFKNFNELNRKDAKKQIINKEYNNLKICFSDLLENKNKESIKEKSNKTDSTIKKVDKNSKDIYYFYKSKTMFNLSNKKSIDFDDKNSDVKKEEIKRKKRKNLSFFKKEINHDFYLYSNENKNKNNIININTNINIKKTNRKISEMDNLIYSKRFNSNKKESDKINLIKKFDSKNINIKKKLHLKLPLTKRINIYSKFGNEFYNKDKIVSFMNRINKKISNKEKNNNYNRNNIINLQGLEQIKRFNFFKEKKRQGLSLGNVNNPTSTIFKIRPSYSSIE